MVRKILSSAKLSFYSNSIFGSTAYIVSGTFLMLSYPSSVIHHPSPSVIVCQLFPNRTGSPIFFINLILGLKKIFWPSRSFYCGTVKLYSQIYQKQLQVYIYHRPPFRALFYPNTAKIRSKVSFPCTLQKVSTGSR